MQVEGAAGDAKDTACDGPFARRADGQPAKPGRVPGIPSGGEEFSGCAPPVDDGSGTYLIRYPRSRLQINASPSRVRAGLLAAVHGPLSNAVSLKPIDGRLVVPARRDTA
jgi:hypothetical protein